MKQLKNNIKIIETLRQSPLFDCNYYLTKYPDVIIDPVIHFVLIGAEKGYNPSKNFDTLFYLEHYPEVKDSGLNALGHYVEFGRAEGRLKNKIEEEIYELKSSGEFDEIYYLESYPDIKDNGLDPIEHYIKYGRQEGRFKSNKEEFEACNIIGIDSNSIDFKSLNALDKQEKDEYYAILCHSEICWDNYFEENECKQNDVDPIIHYIKNWKKTKPVIKDYFDTKLYLSFYQDIVESNMNPLLHYVNIGKEEGRLGFINTDDYFVRGKLDFDPDKKTIVFASHESSATGAPILGYNLSDKLSEKYNIIQIVMKKSNIHELFLSSCDLMITNFDLEVNNIVKYCLEKILGKRKISCVICNSIVTSPVILAANALGLPILTLIHEFSEYIRPVQILTDTVLYSDRIVTPAKLVEQSILDEFKNLHSEIKPQNMFIKPQGKLPLLPESYGEENTVEELKKKLGLDKGVKLVVGAGYVQIRKGVDLFISMAQQVKKMYKGKCKFVWVGGGYDLHKDLAYSIWLKRQIKYSGLGDDFSFLEHQKNLDNLFELTDVFALTSRMDPFPNVVVDVLKHNIHIACFDGSSGCVEFFNEHKVDCTIVDYMNTEQMAAGVTTYLLKNEKKNINKRIIEEQLDFNEYVAFIEKQIVEADKLRRECNRIIDVLMKEDTFNENYSGGVELITPKERCASYVANCLKGIVTDNPKPGFSNNEWINMYNCNNEGCNIVPLYEALKAEVKTTHEVNIIEDMKIEKIKFKYAVHLHLYYEELAAEFADYFKQLPGLYDLYITIKDKEISKKVSKIFAQCGAQNVNILCVKNIGRDFAPLVFDLKEHILKNNYAVIGHFHSKKSLSNENTMGDLWRKYLLNNLIGKEDDVIKILTLFNNPEIGLVFPEDRHSVDMGKNKEFIISLSKMLKIIPPKHTSVFPLGNMFWARIDAIKGIFDLNKDDVLQPEPLPYDGSYAHAIERITPSLVNQNGYKVVTVYKRSTKW